MESLWQVHPTPGFYSPGSSIGLMFWPKISKIMHVWLKFDSQISPSKNIQITSACNYYNHPLPL